MLDDNHGFHIFLKLIKSDYFYKLLVPNDTTIQEAAVLGKYTRNRKNNTAQLKIIRFCYFKKNMKAMVII